MHNFKFSKLLKALLATAIVVLCLLLLWALVLFIIGLHIQWWAKAMILTCLAATVVIAILLRKLWLKRREMKFVDGIIGSDNMPGSVTALDDASRELRRRFKEAVSTLKKSHLKQKGNPLYVLPWYLIVGKSGAGKSTAIKSARLPSPFGDINRVSGIEGTRNCDWWFFDDSVVIDIAGRYSIHRNEDLDKNEWLAFLEHLIKYRKKEPINGVIVTVEADQLLQANLEKIENEGRTIRKRIEEVINVMGAKFPIYLLVTKCDLVFGMNRFYQMLSEESTDQAMGLMNHDEETDISVLINRSIDTVIDKLKDIRLLLANKDEVKGRHYVEPEILLFPNEFGRLRKGLIAFCTGAFKDNPFQELPVVRGVYFCSGQQVGRPVSSKSDDMSKMGSRELPGTGNGFFLHDFFAKILPADRPLYSLTKQAKEWHRLTHNLWLTGFVTIILIFCILLTHSWNENKAAINLVSPNYKKAVLFKNDPVIDIGIMDEFGREIKAIEERNKKWRTPRLGLDSSIELEETLKRRYCQRFYEHFDADMNIKIEGHVANGGWEQNDYEPAIKYIPFITRRINMIRARFNGADAETLSKLPDPNYAMMIMEGERTAAVNDIIDRYKNAYINYLIWQDNVEVLNKTLSGMQRLLKNYFHEDEGDLNWLASWASRQISDKRITLNHYWQSNQPDTEFAAVQPAYTLVGRNLIREFVTKELEIAVEQPLWIVKPRDQFNVWYKNAYYNAWMDFCRNFSQGQALFVTPEEKKAMIERLASEETPYFELIKTMSDQLFTTDEEKWPSLKLADEDDPKYRIWRHQVRDFSIIQHAAAHEGVGDNKAIEQVSNKVSQKTKIVAKIALGTLEESKLSKGKAAFITYRKALTGFGGISSSRTRAYEVAKAGFTDDPAEAASPVYGAHRGIEKLQKMLTAEKPTTTTDEKDPFWSLFSDPVEVLWAYSVEQASCHLQKLWDQEVIVKTEGVYEKHRLVGLLFSEPGYANLYINNHARPFLQRSSNRGYHARKVLGQSVPFKKSYFSFVRRGKSWGTVSSGSSQSHVVDVLAYPTDVNIEAKVKPHMTRLRLASSDGIIELENKQYPIAKKFVFSASKSGDVSLDIMLGDITLTRKYTGYCAFGKFLREFSKGKVIYTVNDFPKYRNEFRRLGVRQIEVSYQLQSSQIKPIVRLLNTTPGRAPSEIITCAN